MVLSSRSVEHSKVYENKVEEINTHLKVRTIFIPITSAIKFDQITFERNIYIFFLN